MPNRIETIAAPLITTVSIFILLGAYTKLVGPLPLTINSVQTTKANFFQAQGVGEETAIPNTAELSFAVTKTANSVLDAQNQTNLAITAILGKLKTLGVEDKNIKTTQYSITPQFNITRPLVQKAQSYTVTQNLEVKVAPLDKANQAIDAATSNGANMIGNLSLILDDTSKQQLQNKAREEAVQNAKTKAETLAKAAGIHLGRIVDIQENTEKQPPVMQPMMAAAQPAGAADASTTITPGENTVSVSVTLSYETY